MREWSGRTAPKEADVPVAGKTLTALALVAGLVVAGCGEEESPSGATAATDTPTSSASPTTSQPAPSTTPPPATDTVVTTGDSEFGVMLFDDRGQAIYLFDRERTSTPDCYDECAAAWPPVVTDGAPQAGGAADPALLGTTQRTDGAVQVTYAGHPLYFYANEGPGEVLCHDVFLNDGWWYVVTPEGSPGPT
jgi:predicted lipoprotein with Yx(FWY)xxD motif